MPDFARIVPWVAASPRSWSWRANQTTRTGNPQASRWRATTPPSPPLFPGPQRISIRGGAGPCGTSGSGNEGGGVNGRPPASGGIAPSQLRQPAGRAAAGILHQEQVRQPQLGRRPHVQPADLLARHRPDSNDHKDAARIPSPSGDGGMAALLLRQRTIDDPIGHMATLFRTICCKLDVTAEQAAAIDDALDRYADACNAIADVCLALGSTNRVDVHHGCYHDIRQRFGLSANHVVRAIARTCIALKVPDKADSVFRPTALDLDVRTFRFHEADWTFGVTLLHGRVRFATLLGLFQRER